MLETILANIVQPLIVGGVSITVALLGIREQNKKQQGEIEKILTTQIGEVKNAQGDLSTEVRIIKNNFDNLKNAVEKHNSVIERTYKLEERMHVAEEKQRVANKRIDDLEDETKELRASKHE